MNLGKFVLAPPLWALAGVIRLLELACGVVVVLTLLFAILYRLGWFHRFIWFLLEQEARKALNGTDVTVGSFDLDLIRGTFWASNVVIHSPQRDVWQWESPLLARVGKVYVETNLVRVLLSLCFLREEPPLEIYTLHLKDIQVFMERKEEVFNIYLLDPHNVIPEPQLNEESEFEKPSRDIDISIASDELSATANGGGVESVDAADGVMETSTPAEEEKAQKLVDEMIKAVQSLGRAAREGSLPEALQQQRQTVTNQLKELQAKPIKSTAMRDGIKIVQHVSKAVVQKTQTVQKIVSQPDKRELENEKVVYARFGRVVMDDLRVFTRSSLTNSGSLEKQENNSTTNPKRKTLVNSWNKPIVVEHLAVRPSEFCAPLTVNDEEGLPVLYRPINCCMDAIFKRVVSEMAKSNTGRLLRTAMGEILDFWVEKELQIPEESKSS